MCVVLPEELIDTIDDKTRDATADIIDDTGLVFQRMSHTFC